MACFLAKNIHHSRGCFLNVKSAEAMVLSTNNDRRHTLLLTLLVGVYSSAETLESHKTVEGKAVIVLEGAQYHNKKRRKAHLDNCMEKIIIDVGNTLDVSDFSPAK